MLLLSLRRPLLLAAFASLLTVPLAAQTPAPADAPAPAPIKPPEATFASPWGIAASGSASGNIADWFPKMTAAGITWERALPPEWGGLEPVKGQWNFAETDAALDIADKNGIHVSGLFFGAPKWVAPGSHTFPMNHLPEWTNYARTMADRYKGRVQYWEVWNEGNAGFNDGHHVTSDYAKLLSAAYEGAKAGDPNALVGLSVASFDAPYIGQVATLLEQMNKAGQFDYICIHPYETFGGIGDPDGEILYLWMMHILKDQLQAVAPTKVNVPVWITEIGRPVDRKTNEVGIDLGKTTTDEDAGRAVVKAYIMALAQGIARIEWFEGQDSGKEQEGYGLLRKDGSPRPGYIAMKSMTGLLGPVPKSLGWLALGIQERGFGFVFQGAAGPVMCFWMPVDTTDKLTFTGDVQVTDPLTGNATALKAGELLPVTNAPVLISGLPADLVAQAQANATKPFPWGGNYAKATTVSLDYMDPKLIKPWGVFQQNPKGTLLHTFPDGSAGITIKGDIGHAVGFYTHPSFANIMTRHYYIRITYRRITPGNVGWNVRYEVADSQGKGPMRSVPGWYSAPADLGWQTKVYEVTDASFGKMWGMDFSINPEQSVPFVVGKVEVSTQPF